MDPIDTAWKTPAGVFTLVDTAGIRHQARFEDEAEFYAVVRALNALQRADIACLVVDAAQGFLRQEARLVHDALEAGCSLLLVYNKWDLIEGREEAWKRLTREREERYPTLAGLPAVPISATAKINLGRLPKLILQRAEEHGRKIPTRELNAWLEKVQKVRAAPATRGGLTPRLYYMTQTGTGPPEFALFVNQPQRLSDNYRRFLWLRLAERFDFHGTPFRLRVRKSE
jgi:GTP-binding protein